MEKYSRFRDESTGIAPFQEARPPVYSALATAALYILAVLTFPFVVTNLALYLFVLQPLLPAVISRAFLNWAVLFLARVLYVLCTYEGENRASVRQKLIRRAGPGDVLLSNFLSPLDPLIYESRQKTWFVLPTADGSFQLLSTLQAMQCAYSPPISVTSTSTLDKIVQRAQQVNAVVVIFVEGTTTNGRGLLTLKNLNVRAIAELEAPVYPAALRYTPASVATPIPCTLVGFLWHILLTSGSYLAAMRIAGQPMPKGSIQRGEISQSISAVGRLRILGDRLDANAKKEYADLRRQR